MRRIMFEAALVAMVVALAWTAAGCGGDDDEGSKCEGVDLDDRYLPLTPDAWWRYRVTSGSENSDKTVSVGNEADELPFDWTFAYTVTEACDKRQRTLIRLDWVVEQDSAVTETAQQWLTQDEIAAAAISHTAEWFEADGTRHAAEVACPAYTGDPDDIYDGELVVDEEFLADGATFPKILVYRLFERAYVPSETTVEWEVTDTWDLVAGAGQEVEVKVPAGTFSCIELNRVRQYLLISGEPDATREDQDQTLWFARKVGQVKQETIGYGAGTEELECWGIAGD